MVKYKMNRNGYMVFNVDDQHVELTPIFDNKDGGYLGVNVIIYSKDRRNNFERVAGKGSIIFDRDIMVHDTLYEEEYCDDNDISCKSVRYETRYDMGELCIHFSEDTIGIEYGCRKK